MDTEIQSRLRELYQLLCPSTKPGDYEGFLQAFKVFRGFAYSSSHNNPPPADTICATKRLKAALPHATVGDVLNRDHQERQLDHLVERLHRSFGHDQAKVPDFLEFLRFMATGHSGEVGDGLWNSRNNQMPSPESGFSTTPSDGPTNGMSVFPESSASLSYNSIKPTVLPLPPNILLPQPPAIRPPPGFQVVTESQMIRDLLCVVLGFDGTLVKLTADGCRLTKASMQINDEMGQIGLKIGYTGWLALKLKKFCDNKQFDCHIGLCSQRTCHMVADELQRFRRNVAILDAKVHRDDPEGTFTDLTNRSHQLSLRKLLHAIQDDQHRLNILLNMVTATNTLKGGELVTALYKFSHHGDPVVQLMSSKLTYAAVEPLLIKMRRWVFSGILDDPFSEFFVMESPEVLSETSWAEHFQLRDNMIPYFLAPDMARQIFAGGKSIAFIKTSKVSDGRARHSQQVVDGTIPGLEKYDAVADCSFTGPDPTWDMQRNRLKMDSLEQIIQACRIAAQAVVNILRDDYNLGSHIYALQKFFLLGQGDFILCLIDSLGDYLDQPAVSLHMRNLSGILETCIQATEARFEHPDVIKALDILIQAVDDREIGWDAMQLEYRLKKKNDVLSIVLTSDILTRYKRIFLFLWRIKRVEFLLCRIWKEDMCSRMEYRKIIGFDILCQETRLLLHRMLQFVQKLQYNFNVQILEIAWTCFQEKLAHAESLDEILSFHNEYLSLVEEKCFIQSKAVKNWKDLGIQLRTVLNQVVKFDTCFGEIEDAVRNELTNLVDQPPNFEGPIYLKTLPSLVTKIQTLETLFKSEVSRFTTTLETNDGEESSSDLRSGLDYNRHYLMSGKKVRNFATLNVAGFDDSGPSSC